MEQIGPDSIIYASHQMETVARLINKIAIRDVTVLIQGESGTGKSLIAEKIHHQSLRSHKQMMTVNCGSIPPNLLESEFFGYEKGAFTGADENSKMGIFEAASGGTLFLDEISEIPLELQSKLLRAIQSKEIMRVGSTTYRCVDVRIIAASNVDLKKAVQQGKFRKDLFYRLNVIPITIEPLRNRPEDIKILADYFLEQLNHKYRSNKTISQNGYRSLLEYNWPGNIRELQNVIENVVVTEDSSAIDANSLKRCYAKNIPVESFSDTTGLPLKRRIEEYEKWIIESEMQYFSKSHDLADSLGIDKSTLLRKMKKYGIQNPYWQ